MDIKEQLEKNKWYPIIKPTNAEMRDAEVFNNIMDLIIALPDENARIMFVLGLRNSLDTIVDKNKDTIKSIIDNL